MKTIISNNQEWLFVEVSDDDTICGISNNILHLDNQVNSYTQELPSKDYQIHADTFTITNEQAAEIVEETVVDFGGELVYGYTAYSSPQNELKTYYTAMDSFHSLMRLHNLTGRFIILKKQKS